MISRRSRTVCMTKRLPPVTFVSIFTSLSCVFFDTRLAFAAASDSGASKPDTINLLVGFRPGAAYGLYARLTARYMLRYLPGNDET